MRVLDRPGLAALAATAEKADPAGDRRRQRIGHLAGGEPLAHRRKPAHRDLLRAVDRDLAQAMAERGVGETREQCLPVTSRNAANLGRQRRREIIAPHPLDEGAQRRLGDRLVDRRQPRRHAETGERRMRGIQQAQLHRLERRHVANELDAVARPVRTAGGEPILDDPLRETFGADRTIVAQPGQRQRLIAIGRHRGRHDPVDHRVRAGDPLVDESGEPRVAAPLRGLCQYAMQRIAVHRQVVARQQRQRPGAIGRALREPVGEQRDRAAIAVDIALLGDRQRHDAHRRIGQSRNGTPRLDRIRDRLAQRADDPRLRAAAATHQQRVQAILRVQRIDDRPAAQVDAADRPAGLAGGQRVVGVDGLVRAVEIADAEMDDADARLARVEARPRAGRQTVERGERQPFARHCRQRALPRSGKSRCAGSAQRVLGTSGYQPGRPGSRSYG